MSTKMESRGSITQAWVKDHGELYRAATRHPFILSICDGSLDLTSFKQWLGQDYLFVKSFARFAASVLLKLPLNAAETDLDAILVGLAALKEEVTWFRAEASKWQIQLNDLTPLPANQKYCRFLNKLCEPDTEYPVAISAFWAIEVVYNDSFAACLAPGSKTPPTLQGACERWGNDGFKKYCMALQGMVDQVLQGAPMPVQKKAEEIFVQVLLYEADFWSMSLDHTE